MGLGFEEKDFLSCCGSTKFAKDMDFASPFSSFQHALSVARDIWFNNVGVNGWLQAFSAHPSIGQTSSPSHTSQTSAQWSKGEQPTATGSSLQELSEWNARYVQKFGFVFLICASGRSVDEILAELKRRYTNRPIVEFEIAAQEQMKITELRLAKLFSSRENISSTTDMYSTTDAKKAGAESFEQCSKRTKVSASGVYSSSSNPETPTSYEYDPTSHLVLPMGKKEAKRKGNTKATETSSDNSEFNVMQNTLKEKMTIMAELLRVMGEENKLKERELKLKERGLKFKELQILLNDISRMTERQRQDYEIICNMIRKSHGIN